MDHRSVNTKKKIRTTYFAMLMNKEPINGRSLVKKANINKSIIDLMKEDNNDEGK